MADKQGDVPMNLAGPPGCSDRAFSLGWPSSQVLTKFRSPGDPNQANLEGAAAQGDSGGGLPLM